MAIAQVIGSQTTTTINLTAESGVNLSLVGAPSKGVPLEPTISAAGTTPWVVQQEVFDGTDTVLRNIVINGEATHEVIQAMIATSNTTDGESIFAPAIIDVEDDMQAYVLKVVDGNTLTWAADGTFTGSNQPISFDVVFFSPSTGEWSVHSLTISKSGVTKLLPLPKEFDANFSKPNILPEGSLEIDYSHALADDLMMYVVPESAHLTDVVSRRSFHHEDPSRVVPQSNAIGRTIYSSGQSLMPIEEIVFSATDEYSISWLCSKEGGNTGTNSKTGMITGKESTQNYIYMHSDDATLLFQREGVRLEFTANRHDLFAWRTLTVSPSAGLASFTSRGLTQHLINSPAEFIMASFLGGFSSDDYDFAGEFQGLIIHKRALSINETLELHRDAYQIVKAKSEPMYFAPLLVPEPVIPPQIHDPKILGEMPAHFSPEFSNPYEKPDGEVVINRENKFGKDMSLFFMPQLSAEDVIHGSLKTYGNPVFKRGLVEFPVGSSATWLQYRQKRKNPEAYTFLCKALLRTTDYAGLFANATDQEWGANTGGLAMRPRNGVLQAKVGPAYCDLPNIPQNQFFTMAIIVQTGKPLCGVVNGAPSATGDLVTSIFESNSPPRIGTYHTGTDSWEGEIEYQAIVDRGLSFAEIAEFHAAPYQAVEPAQPPVVLFDYIPFIYVPPFYGLSLPLPKLFTNDFSTPDVLPAGEVEIDRENKYGKDALLFLLPESNGFIDAVTGKFSPPQNPLGIIPGGNRRGDLVTVNGTPNRITFDEIVFSATDEFSISWLVSKIVLGSQQGMVIGDPSGPNHLIYMTGDDSIMFRRNSNTKTMHTVGVNNDEHVWRTVVVRDGGETADYITDKTLVSTNFPGAELRFNVFLSGYNSSSFDFRGDGQGLVVHNRALSVEEVRAFHRDPYQALKPVIADEYFVTAEKPKSKGGIGALVSSIVSSIVSRIVYKIKGG